MLSSMTSAAARAARPVLKRNMSAITGVKGRFIIDSRGNPTVEVSKEKCRKTTNKMKKWTLLRCRLHIHTLLLLLLLLYAKGLPKSRAAVLGC